MGMFYAPPRGRSRVRENIDVDIPERGVFDEEEELEITEADVQGVFDALDDIYGFISELEVEDEAKDLLALVKKLDDDLIDLFQLEEEEDEEDVEECFDRRDVANNRRRY